MEKKITRKDNFNTLRELVMNCVDSNTEQDRLLAFIDHEIEQIDKRAISAKKYAKKSNKASDALAAAIADLLKDGVARSIPEIIAAVPEEFECSPQKVTYRLTKLIEAGAVKSEVVSYKEDGKAARRVTMYTYIDMMETEEE